MAKALDDFRVIINLGGLHLRGQRPYQEGQIVQGRYITEGLVDLLKQGRKFRRGDTELDVCALLEGKLEDLEKAMAEAPAKPMAKKPEPPPAPKKGDPGMKVVEAEDDKKPSVEKKNIEVSDGVKTGTSAAKPKKKDSDK
jgi:hypothetical protein